MRVPLELWPLLKQICKDINANRDLLVDGKWTPSTIFNVAMRDWLIESGHDASAYLSEAEEEQVAA